MRTGKTHLDSAMVNLDSVENDCADRDEAPRFREARSLGHSRTYLLDCKRSSDGRPLSIVRVHEEEANDVHTSLPKLAWSAELVRRDPVPMRILLSRCSRKGPPGAGEW